MKNSQFLTYEGDHPKGTEYINWIFSKDDLKENLTFNKFEKDKENNPLQTYSVVGDLLSVTYKLSVCDFGCRGGDHRIEYIIGKAYNTAVASLKLLRLGFYDESLSLIRSISEITNLLCLFRIEPNSYKDWVEATEQERIRNFGPAKIRKKIISVAAQPPVDKEYYSKLCEIGVHVNPETRPAGYNKHKLALVGGFVMDHAPTAILNDLANNLFFCALMGSSCILEKDDFMNLTDDLKKMVEQIGDLTIMNLEEHIEKLNKAPNKK